MNINKNIKAVILAGGCDFHPHSAGIRLSTPLWPVVGKSVLERLLVHLSAQGIERAVICSNGDTALLVKSINTDNCPRLEFVDESLPLGTAGCIRAAAGDDKDALLLVFAAGMVCPPDIDWLIHAHHSGKSDLTILFNPGRENSNIMGESAGIYVCGTSVLEHIPKEGYCDIKEGLIPEMLRNGKTVHAAVLPNPAGNFRNWHEYLCAIGGYLENQARTDLKLQISKQDDSRMIWAGLKTDIHPSVRMFGPVVVMEGACISKDAVIFGPAILGRNVRIGEDSVVANSVLWDNAQAGSNCRIRRCVIDSNRIVRSGSIIEDKFLTCDSEKSKAGLAGGALAAVRKNMGKLQSALLSQIDRVNGILPDFLQSNEKKITPYLIGALLLAAFLWSYWPGLNDIWKIWQSSDEYSSGVLVPFLAVYILWSRRHLISQVRIKPSVWGLFAFAVAQGIRFFGLFFMYSSAERLSIVLSIASLVLLLFGWAFLRKVSTILLFLCLMLPWPNRVQAVVAQPLQHWATSSAVFCLETIGYDVVREGNIIHLGETTVAVAEACNGLRMVTAFFVISGMVVLLINRAWWEKWLVLVSCLPIALLCNTIRLVITAIAFTMLKGEYWERMFHDFGGYAMMPLALGLIVAELWLLTKLTTPPSQEETIIVTRQK